MNEYETEEQQVAALKTWWKENGTSLIVGLFVGVSALFGWRYYAEQNNAKAVQATLSGLVESGQLTEPLAAAIDVAPIAEFFDSKLGQLAQQAGGRVYREWPFTYGLDAATVGARSSDEIIVLQGIIDMIIPTENGLVIVDFKTDRVTESEIAERAKKYIPQMQSYATAAADILKQPVIAAQLYFLHPQKSVKVVLLHDFLGTDCAQAD